MCLQEMTASLAAVTAPDGSLAGQLSAACICDHTGNIWGQTDGFPGVLEGEADKIMALFADPGSNASNGIWLGGTKVRGGLHS